MKDKTLDRIAYVTIFIIGFGFIAWFVLLGWGFIELIQWLTSK